MSARLTELQHQLGQSRRRLEELALRVAALRERVGGSAEAPAPAGPRAPLFGGLGMGKGALDDVELTFEVLDTEIPAEKVGEAGRVKLFAAGAGLADLGPCLRLGLCTGVVIDRGATPAGGPSARELVMALGALVDGPVFLDAAGAGDAPDAAALEVRARELASLGGAVVARVPFGEAGLAAIRACAKAGLKMNAVGCTTTVEALAAARAGATWISPSWDLPADAAARAALYEPLRKIVAALQSYRHAAEVLVGPAPDRSILVDVMFAGVHAASSRPAALHEIARRRAEGLESAGSGS